MRNIIGCAGLLLLWIATTGASSEAVEEHLAEQTEASRDIANALQSIAKTQSLPPRSFEPTPLERACTGRSEDRRSELCAQWTAADAASAALLWAKISAIVSACGILGLFLTLRQGQRNLSSAQEANRIALQAIKADHRPTIEISAIGNYLDHIAPVVGLAMHYSGTTQLIMGQVMIRNRGAADVIIVKAYVKLDGQPNRDRGQALYRILKAGDEVALDWSGLCDPGIASSVDTVQFGTVDETRDFILSRPSFVGYVEFEDVLSIRRRRFFSLKPVSHSHPTRFDPDGEERNYETEIAKEKAANIPLI